MTKLLGLWLLVPLVTSAQPAGTIQAAGTATLFANPDQAYISIGVVTDGSTAQDAAQRNSTQATAVLNALKQVLGNAGTIQTVSYSVNPRYSSTAGQAAVIVGYTASNTLQVTTLDLSLIGSLIDTANQAGANSVGGLQFSLRDPEPLKQQALGQAAKQARAHADAIAAGLGAKTGALVSAQEAGSVSPVVIAGAAAAAPTPIQTGQVSVTASVTITVQLAQ
jgi:uncharacterized protein YggE